MSTMTVAHSQDSPPILLAEANPAVARSFVRALSSQGFSVRLAGDSVTVLATLAREPFALVIQDLGRQTIGRSVNERIELFRAVHRIRPRLPILLLAPWSAADLAAQLMSEGATDYLSMPCNEDRLASVTRRLLDSHDRAPLASARAELAARVDLCDVAYGTPCFHQLVMLAVRAAPFHTPVLITGPTGSGRGRLARIVQANSPRRELPFLCVHGPDLAADEIARWRRSRIPLRGGTADDCAEQPRGGGTVLVENLHELAPASQVALLEFLRDVAAARDGRERGPEVDLRLLATAAESLQQAANGGRFSRALYRQFADFEISVPPLSERPADTIALAHSFLAAIPDRLGAPWSLDEEAKQVLADTPWPDGSHGLRNAVRQATEASRSPSLAAADFGLASSRETAGLREKRLALHKVESTAPQENHLALLGEGEERLRLEEALARSGGIVSRAAESLGLSRQSFYRRLQRHGLSSPSSAQGH